MTFMEKLKTISDGTKQVLIIISFLTAAFGVMSGVIYTQLNKRYATIEALSNNVREIHDNISALSQEQVKNLNNTSVVAYIVLSSEIEKYDVGEWDSWSTDKRNRYLNIHRQLWEASISSGKLIPTASYNQPF